VLKQANSGLRIGTKWLGSSAPYSPSSRRRLKIPKSGNRVALDHSQWNLSTKTLMMQVGRCVTQ